MRLQPSAYTQILATLGLLISAKLIREEKFPVIGVTPAVIGAIQATEVVKYLVGIGELLTNKLLIYDGLTMKFTELKVKKDPLCGHCSKASSEDNQ